jgi:integrase/recombinase XerD
MERNLSISFYLDTRRSKANGKFPVKLRVFTHSPRIQKLYPTTFEFSEAEFKSIWETTKPRTEYKTIRYQMQAVETKAIETANELNPFTFEQFEKKLYRKTGAGSDVFYQYEIAIEKLKGNKQFGTASNYDLAVKAIKGFLETEKGKVPKTLSFTDITPDWLGKFENYMVNTKGRSRTTLSMYVRTLRTVFNTAISEDEIKEELYPFGKRKYNVPAVKKVKKALSAAELKTLFQSKPKTVGEQIAKDFWFFSYVCNGMNMKDIALLRYKDLNEDSFVFYRAKTINTSKADLTPVTVYLNDFSKGVIERYGNENKKPGNLIFSINDDDKSPEWNFRKVKEFTRYVNKHIKRLAESLSITSDLSTYWARHSFATTAIRNGASMEFVGEALSHSNTKTTFGYFAGFEQSTKKQIMNKLLEFEN